VSVTTERELLLVTGGAGHVAHMVIPALRERYRLRLFDREPLLPVDDDEVVRGDICDQDTLEAACRGASAIVHLAADANADSVDFLTALVPNNVVGTWSVFEAAVRSGVPRLIFASTVQTVDGGPQMTPRSLEMSPRPVSLYACTKLFGEATARYYSDRHGLSVTCLRIGWVEGPDSPVWEIDPNLPLLWCDPGDLSRLIVAALTADVRFATVYALSGSASERFDISNPFGWRPTAAMPRPKRSRFVRRLGRRFLPGVFGRDDLGARTRS
jgi:nucleoside-diphosphate-sugar epimerase